MSNHNSHYLITLRNYRRHGNLKYVPPKEAFRQLSAMGYTVSPPIELDGSPYQTVYGYLQGRNAGHGCIYHSFKLGKDHIPVVMVAWRVKGESWVSANTAAGMKRLRELLDSNREVNVRFTIGFLKEPTIVKVFGHSGLLQLANSILPWELGETTEILLREFPQCIQYENPV